MDKDIVKTVFIDIILEILFDLNIAKGEIRISYLKLVD